MHIRINRVKTKTGVREYAQLVESYRRASDSMPATRVLATLGAPDSLVVQNMRRALEAARQGKHAAVIAAPVDRLPTKPECNLRYLDAAVLLELWNRWGLAELVDELIPDCCKLTRASAVVATLAVQRCLEPGSKLAACRWVPRTALPELCGFAPSSFNNTRVHRALDQLEEAVPSLMAALPGLYRQRQQAFTSVFIDVTDTWFVGHGPEMATSGKTKEGMTRRKIGIVLMCNEHNYPLRWEVLEGRRNDSSAMSAMLKDVAGLDWLQAVPVVMDRAMGQTAHVRELLAAGIDFITALTSTEFDSYAPKLPFDALRHLEVEALDDKVAACQAAQCVSRAGLSQRADNQWVLDLGLVEHSERDDAFSSQSELEQDPLARALKLAASLKLAIDQNRYRSYAAASRAMGMTPSLGRKYLQLLTLSASIQREVLEGKAHGRTLTELLRIASMPHEEQYDAFVRALAQPAVAVTPKKKPAEIESSPDDKPIKVRAVGCFNPEMFVEQRRGAGKQLARIATMVAELQARVTKGPGRYSVERIHVQIDRMLQKESLLDAYAVHVARSATGYTIDVKLDTAVWSRRRLHDGWSVLVAHPRLSISEHEQWTASKLCELYRAKDAVEKDFQTIKSFLKLRPVRHHNDDKVRAHVAVCMLALLLERTLHNMLANAKPAISSATALELLEPCRLNRFAGRNGESPAYLLTETDEQQRRILSALNLRHLADDAFAIERLSKAC